MKKVLIIGDLTNSDKILSDYLSDKYQVQLCAKQLDIIQSMVEILKPDLAIISNLELENDHPILDWIQDKYAKLPVLISSENNDEQGYMELFEKEQFEMMPSLLTKNSLQTMCEQILAKNKSGRKKILIVDDTPLMLRNIKKMLDNTYDVVLASSGRQALYTIQTEEVDLVLLDYEMPEMDGREVFETMLADNEMKDIPVVFLTGVSDRQAVVSILQSKPAGYILKSASQEKLLNTINEVLNK